jgi:hypothetical protein
VHTCCTARTLPKSLFLQTKNTALPTLRLKNPSDHAQSTVDAHIVSNKRPRCDYRSCAARSVAHLHLHQSSNCRTDQRWLHRKVFSSFVVYPMAHTMAATASMVPLIVAAPGGRARKASSLLHCNSQSRSWSCRAASNDQESPNTGSSVATLPDVVVDAVQEVRDLFLALFALELFGRSGRI